MKTAMQELRNKILLEVQNLKEPSHNNEHIKGYREALKNVANDIDSQMLRFERQQIINAYDYGRYNGDNHTTLKDGEQYYNETYNETNNSKA